MARKRNLSSSFPEIKRKSIPFIPQNKYLRAVLLLALTLGVGVTGFKIILKTSWLDSFYFTVVTLSTVGYGDLVSTGAEGHLFTTLFILGGIATVSYSAAILLETIIEGKLQGEYRIRKMNKKIENVKDHIILCGFGRVGRDIGNQFIHEHIPCVVIDENQERFEAALNRRHLCILGDGTRDEILERARIKNAFGLITALPDDANNLFIVISARQLNPDLKIVSRASEEINASKMKRAGANRVILPSLIGAQHLAHSILRPTVMDFIALSDSRAKAEYRIEEFPISENSLIANKTLIESDLRGQAGVIAIGVRRTDDTLVFNPSGNTYIYPGDILVAMGNEKQLQRLLELT